ncbi:hypothetical protein ES703_84142 [subsurface metagenome]
MNGEDMSFFEGRMEVLMEQIRDALDANAAQSERMANAMEKMTECINDRAGHAPYLRTQRD